MLEELWDEVADFGEDFWELLTKQRSSPPRKEKEVIVSGVLTRVRPAYLFAERVDNILKVIFGASIAISGVAATFLGYTSISEMLNILISTFWGRATMLVIGISYLIISLWRLMHLGKKANV